MDGWMEKWMRKVTATLFRGLVWQKVPVRERIVDTQADDIGGYETFIFSANQEMYYTFPSGFSAMISHECY